MLSILLTCASLYKDYHNQIFPQQQHHGSLQKIKYKTRQFIKREPGTRGSRVSSDLSRLMTKPTKWHVPPAKTQISMGIRPVWSESSLCAQWVAKDHSFLHADSKDSDQTGRMPRLIWVFAGRTCHFVGFVMRRLYYGSVIATAGSPVLRARLWKLIQ